MRRSTFVCLVAALGALGGSPAAARRLRQDDDNSWRTKQPLSGPRADSSQGEDPGGPTDSFATFAEASSLSKASGMYFSSDQAKVVRTGDGVPNPLSYGYAGNDKAQALASNIRSENNQIYGTHMISQTYEGARAVAGSGTAFTAARGKNTALASNRMTYGPGPGPKPLQDPRRSVAFTDVPATSVAMDQTGNGPAALATGEQVAAFARASRSRKAAPVTVGHREAGDKGSHFFTRRRLAASLLREVHEARARYGSWQRGVPWPTQGRRL